MSRTDDTERGPRNPWLVAGVQIIFWVGGFAGAAWFSTGDAVRPHPAAAIPRPPPPLPRRVHGSPGASRSGKSIFLNTLLAYGSLARDVWVVIIDPNTAAVAPWRTAYLVCNSPDPAEATKGRVLAGSPCLFRHVHEAAQVQLVGHSDQGGRPLTVVVP